MGKLKVLPQITNDESKDYDAWLTDAKNKLAKNNVKALAIVAILDESPTTLTGYWHMSAIDKAMAATHLQTDSTFDLVETYITNLVEGDE